jgi:hypothetical protein
LKINGTIAHLGLSTLMEPALHPPVQRSDQWLTIRITNS